MAGTNIVLLRGWPGVTEWKSPRPSARQYPRLWQRNALYLFAAAQLDVMPEELGLGAALVASGRSVSNACLIVPDDLAAVDPDALAAIASWAAYHSIETSSGPRPWHVATPTEFFDPYATVEAQPWSFQPTAYSGAGFVVSADLGRTFGLAAEHCSPRVARATGSWEVWLPGWGNQHHDGWKRASRHRPALRMEARRVGWQVEFGPTESGNGKRVDGYVWRGSFVDVMSLAYSLDADRGASFAEHCENFGLPAFELPLTVTVDANGVEQVTEAIQAIRCLALALDEESGHWFTTPTERREKRGKFNLARTVSPAALAAEVPARFGVRPPLEISALTDEEHHQWAEAFHGGWCEADPRLIGVPFHAASADVSSCFPLAAHHLGWWDLMCAERVERVEVTAPLLELCAAAVSDPTVVLDPAAWHRLGVTLVEVIPDGEHFPVGVDDPRRPDGRLEVVPVRSEGRSMWFAWPDVVNAAMLSGRVPDIRRATRYAPVGRQDGLRRRLPILPGVVLDANQDPVLPLVRRRQLEKRRATRAEARGDETAERAHLRLAALLRVVVNILVFGNPSRIDSGRRYDRRTRKWMVIDKCPGPWSSLPIASSVTAGARLLLGVVERQFSDLGGVVAYRDTDSALVPSTRHGDKITLDDASTIRSLPWDEVDSVLESFSPLSPGPGWPVWRVKRDHQGSPLRAVVFSPKRHAEFIRAATGIELVGATEQNLGGTYADPPALRGRVVPVDGYRAFSMSAVRREVEFALARTELPCAVRPSMPAPWDPEGQVPFPALARLMVRTPGMLDQLPPCLGARPGTRYVEAEVRSLGAGGTPMVALDPGGDLADWQHLAWVNKDDGSWEAVSTDPGDEDLATAQLVSLDDKGADWSRRSRVRPIDNVVVDDSNIRFVGRASGVLDAAGDGSPGGLDSYRPVYDDADRLGMIYRYAREVGPQRFARLTGIALRVCERAAAGQPISPRNVAKALPAMERSEVSRKCACCDEEFVPRRSDQRFLDRRHRERAKKRRQRKVTT
jgi:hypothetical protein